MNNILIGMTKTIDGGIGISGISHISGICAMFSANSQE